MVLKNKFQQENRVSLPAPTSEYLSCGYAICHIEETDDKWKCIFCKLIIKDPIQLTECGHRACKGCFKSKAVAAAIDENMICPVEDCHIGFRKTEILPDRAFKRELELLSVVCFHKTSTYCCWKGVLKNYQEHLDQDHIHFPCHLCEEVFSFSQALSDHKAKECSCLFESCPLAPLCSEEKILRTEYENHLLSEKHQEAIILILTGKHNIQESVNQHQTMKSTSTNDEHEQQVSGKLSDLTDKVQQLYDDTVQSNHDFVKLNELAQLSVQELNNFQVAINNKNSIMNSLKRKQEVIRKQIEEVKLGLEENQHVSTDGTLTWRVDHVAERIADAQSERQPSIYSPIFYSGPTGYKMRAGLYLLDDGNARQTHISLFFLIMKGEYDAILPWPFRFKVTFCLLDQTGNNRHIIDSFCPDVKSDCFQRPKTGANIARGIPKFFPLPMIQQDHNAYVREDTLFLKIIVDFNETPKMILPYMLSLNPGLPNHVQQLLIIEEKAKRQKLRSTENIVTTQSVSINTGR